MEHLSPSWFFLFRVPPPCRKPAENGGFRVSEGFADHPAQVLGVFLVAELLPPPLLFLYVISGSTLQKKELRQEELFAIPHDFAVLKHPSLRSSP